MIRRSKFNVSKDKTKRTCDGIEFDSELEMRYYRNVIKKSIDAGTIKKFARQQKFVLQPAFKHNGKIVRAIEYKADFVIDYADGRTEAIDIKGFATPEAQIKKKLFLYVYPEIDYKWIGYSKIDSLDGSGFVDYEMIKEGQRARKKQKELRE